MARIRSIKPGIMTNEDLCELGPYAYILFTGLWMLADREGRLEYRPRRIKAEAMPLWEEVSAEAVENLLEKLCANGFLLRYEVGGTPYLQIVKWKEHQRPDPREQASRLPPPPSVNGGASTTSEDSLELHRQDSETSPPCRVGYGRLVMGDGNKIVETRTQNRPAPPPVENPTTTTPKTPTQTPRKPAARASSSGTHKAEDVAQVRESLSQLAIATRMPPPDDGIVHRVIDAARGAGGGDICEVLVELWKRRKFQSMYSWGFVPLVISQVFKAA